MQAQVHGCCCRQPPRSAWPAGARAVVPLLGRRCCVAAAAGLKPLAATQQGPATAVTQSCCACGVAAPRQPAVNAAASPQQQPAVNAAAAAAVRPQAQGLRNVAPQGAAQPQHGWQQAACCLVAAQGMLVGQTTSAAGTMCIPGHSLLAVPPAAVADPGGSAGCGRRPELCQLPQLVHLVVPKRCLL